MRERFQKWGAGNSAVQASIQAPADAESFEAPGHWLWSLEP